MKNKPCNVLLSSTTTTKNNRFILLLVLPTQQIIDYFIVILAIQLLIFNSYQTKFSNSKGFWETGNSEKYYFPLPEIAQELRGTYILDIIVIYMKFLPPS